MSDSVQFARWYQHIAEERMCTHRVEID